MTKESAAYKQIADEIAADPGENPGDVIRYIVAPAMLEMIGPVNGKTVLDLYCGAGYLSRRLAAMGAEVTAVDSSERLVGIAREIDRREDSRIHYAVAEPTDLSVIEDSTFDDVVCNMGLMITRDLAGTIAELARLVKLGGRFVFSIAHPCFNMPDSCWVRDEDGRYLYKIVDNYYTEAWWSSDLANTIRSKTRVRHRTLSHYANAIGARGFSIRRIAEPRPSPEILTLKPHLEIHDRIPPAMVVEAIFPYL